MSIILIGKSIADLEQQIEELKRAGIGVEEAPAALSPADELERKVRKLKIRATRTTGKVWDIVLTAAKLPDGEFTLQDIATAMGETLKSVRSWHRILGRPLKRLDLKVFDHVTGTMNPNKFTMSADVRRAVLAV